jgi:hypothetical protein
MRPLFVDINGGPGGNGGDAGIGGEGGRGGAPGSDSWPWCDEEPSRVGVNGRRGTIGQRGGNGPDGPDGSFTLQPITMSDWNAVFNKPWLTRLEPWQGIGGSTVHIVAKNITADVLVLFDGLPVASAAVDVIAGTLDFTVPLDAIGGLHSVALRLMGVSGALFSNTVSFRLMPQLLDIAPADGVPGTPITIRGRGFANGAQLRLGGVTFPATFDNSQQLRLTLPDHENIGMDDGVKDVQVVNPDGRESEVRTFDLSLDIIVRVKAWRVVSDLPITVPVAGNPPITTTIVPQPGRDEEDIRDLFLKDSTPEQVWIGHHIRLVFDPNIGTALVPADLAMSWPREGMTQDENADILKARAADDSFLHFEDGAVNFYFVSDIDDWTTHAYTYRGLEGSRSEFVIFEDTPFLTDWEEAHVSAHELGHVFGLAHICNDDEDERAGTTLKRACDQAGDSDFLMYPSTNFWTDEGNTLAVEEARIARRVARLWHKL